MEKKIEYVPKQITGEMFFFWGGGGVPGGFLLLFYLDLLFFRLLSPTRDNG
jgi:hypothetical protein